MNKYKTLDEFYADQKPDRLENILKLRELILLAEPTLQENLKWNAANFVHEGQDRITFNIQNKQDQLKVVLHCGATIPEDKKAAPVLNGISPLIEWNSNIRGMITFESAENILKDSEEFIRIIKTWLAFNPQAE